MPTSTGRLVLLTGITILFCVLAASSLWLRDITVTRENRIIENTQVFFLTLAAAMHALQVRQQPVSATTTRLCHMVLGMLCVSILVREIDIDKFGPQTGWAVTENLIRITGGLAWIWLLTLGYRRHLSLWRNKVDILMTSTSVLTGLGVILYMASWFFDKSVVPFSLALSQLWEEALQMSGTVVLFTAALRPISLHQS